MKIVWLTCLLSALTLDTGTVALRGAGTNDVPRVGALRQFDRFTFTGNTSYPAWNLWLALNSTYDFPEQSHPLAPRGPFLEAVGHRLRLGYEHCGFPDARVTAHYDAKSDRVVVRIKEGPRYRCGPVEVSGAHQMPFQPIVKALTETNADHATGSQPFEFLDNAPANRATAAEVEGSTNPGCLWIAGQPAPFDDLSRRYLAGLVANTLHQHGFFFSRFNLKVVTNAQARTAALHVNIRQEGPPATIKRMQVVGNHRNSRDNLLHYLGLKSGMRYTHDLAATINDRLYHSARFLTNSVSAGAPDAAGRLTLTIHVVENNQGPPLKTEFAPNEQTLLKARDWLAKVGATREDAVLTMMGYPDSAAVIELMLAPRRGLLLLQEQRVAGTNRLRHALILATNQVALYDPERRQKFVAQDSLMQFTTRARLETYAPDKHGECVNLTLAAGLNHLADATNAAPCVFSLSLAPAAFVRLAHRSNSVCRVAGHELLCSNADTVLRLDARTGRFIELTVKDDKSSRHRQMQLRFQPAVFGPAVERVEQAGAGFANVYDTNAPLGSFVGFFGSELARLQYVEPWLRARLPAVTCARLPTLLHKLGTGAVFSSFKELLASQTPSNNPAGPFEIPQAPHPGPTGTIDAWIFKGFQGMLTYGDALLPVGSWPWTLGRDYAMLARGQRRYLLPDLDEIYESRHTGPLGCLAAASLLQSLDPSRARAMAGRGLERLSTAAFDGDCRLLLDPNKFSGQLAVALAGTLHQLDGPELDGLVAPLPSAPARFIQDCARCLRRTRRNQPLAKALEPALNAYWQSALQQVVAGRLRKIARD